MIDDKKQESVDENGIPLRTDIVILPADDPNRFKINIFCVEETVGICMVNSTAVKLGRKTTEIGTGIINPRGLDTARNLKIKKTKLSDKK